MRSGLAQLDIVRTRDLLQDFDFSTLFVEQLGWSQSAAPNPRTWTAGGEEFGSLEIARLGGVAVLEITAADGEIPDARMRRAVYAEVQKVHHENLLIFVNGERSQSIWYWVKRDGAKSSPRDHFFFKHQPGDLFLSKLSSLVIDVTDLDAEGNVSVAQIARRLREALDVERVTKRFYDDFQRLHERFLDFIEGIDNERDRRWYASVLLNRLMFVYFLQKKGFLDRGDRGYLRNKLEASRQEGEDRYYGHFLQLLFFEGFAKPEEKRSAEALRVVGEIRYLDGGLFLPHKVEIGHPGIRIPDAAFEEIFDLFEGYSWNLNDTPGGDDNEINPDVLGYIFERYINQKQFGAYYTRPEITRYLCEKAIHPLILERVNAVSSERPFESIEEMLLRLNPHLCRMLWAEILPQISILDPACGSGAFLVAALKTLIDVYAVVLGRAKLTSDSFLQREIRKIEKEHPSTYYWIKKRIITFNLFGVDIMEEATEIAKLRLFLTLVASATRVEDLEPLPNIDFNILAGNSLIGLLEVKEDDFDNRTLFRQSFRQVLAEKNRRISHYRNADSYAEKLLEIRSEIEEEKQKATLTLNEILMGEFQRLGIRYEEATWDEKAGKEGRAKKRPLKFEDIDNLQPFHWAYEFDQILQHGGFDVILTNPPWEVFKPQAKEFFAEHSGIVTKNKMTIEDFEKEQARLLKDANIRTAWFAYKSRFPHVNLFFRRSPDYIHQGGQQGEGKGFGFDLNLYKLFLERCFSLLRQNGSCGILLPTSYYTDKGAYELRKLLLEEARVEALFGISNEKFIFEEVHHSFRMCILAFRRGGTTESVEVAFRINPREAVGHERLEAFLEDQAEHLRISAEMIKKLSPDLSMLEFKTEADVGIAEKVLRLPRIGERLGEAWNLVLKREFHMTGDSHLFKREPGPGRLPVFEGKMIHQFTHLWGKPRYWMDEKEAREVLLASRLREIEGAVKRGVLESFDPAVIILDYEVYRLAFRDIARSTDERTMIATLLPPKVVCPHTVTLESVFHDVVNDGAIRVNVLRAQNEHRLLMVSLLNSFVFDYLVRQRVATHLSFFIVYNLPAPRVASGDWGFWDVVERAVRLLCVSPEFSDLWQEVTRTPWSADMAAVKEDVRQVLRAELDGLVAHLYGLTEEEFSHILSSFPIVPEAVKDAALAAYRDFAPLPGDPKILALLAQGESAQLEFKSTARWDLKEQKKNPALEDVIVHTVAGFLNNEGGTLLIGVADDGTIVGLAPDYQTLKKKKNRDGFELFLTELLLRAIGKGLASAIRTSFHQVDGKDVCQVVVSASPGPVFVREGNEDVFWLRIGNSTRKLSAKEVLEHSKRHWR